jgi:hypothetical protein
VDIEKTWHVVSDLTLGAGGLDGLAKRLRAALLPRL